MLKLKKFEKIKKKNVKSKKKSQKSQKKCQKKCQNSKRVQALTIGTFRSTWG